MNVAIKEFIIHDENNNNSIPNKNIIKNPDNETSKDIMVKPKKDVMFSGSNYQNIIPNVGVRILEENKTKNGGLDFKNQFGRMSMKEYELLRQKYSKNNESNYYNLNKAIDNENNYNEYNNKENNEIKVEKLIRRSHTYDKNDNNKNNQETNNKKEDMIYNNIFDRINDNHIHNFGLKHYDWGNYENTNIPALINNGNKIINENLFKKNYKRKHSLYGNYYSDKNIKTNKEINFFNNQILQNKNWGNDNEINKYRTDKRSFTNSIKKNEGINMRTRKKI